MTIAQGQTILASDILALTGAVNTGSLAVGGAGGDLTPMAIGPGLTVVAGTTLTAGGSFRRAATFGPLIADGGTYNGYLTVATGTSPSFPVTLCDAWFQGTISGAGVLTVSSLYGTLAGNPWIGGVPGGPYQIISQLSGTTNFNGTYQLSGSPPTISVAQTINAIVVPWASSMVGKGIQLACGTGGVMTTYTIAAIVDPCNFTITVPVVKQWAAAYVSPGHFPLKTEFPNIS